MNFASAVDFSSNGTKSELFHLRNATDSDWLGDAGVGSFGAFASITPYFENLDDIARYGFSDFHLENNGGNQMAFAVTEFVFTVSAAVNYRISGEFSGTLSDTSDFNHISGWRFMSLTALDSLSTLIVKEDESSTIRSGTAQPNAETFTLLLDGTSNLAVSGSLNGTIEAGTYEFSVVNLLSGNGSAFGDGWFELELRNVQSVPDSGYTVISLGMCFAIFLFFRELPLRKLFD